MTFPTPPDVPSDPAIPAGLFAIDLNAFDATPLSVCHAIREAIGAALIIPGTYPDEPTHNVIAPLLALPAEMQQQIITMLGSVSGMVGGLLKFRILSPDQYVESGRQLGIAIQRVKLWLESAQPTP